MKTFAATIIKLGINPCVNVPEEIVVALLHEAQKKNAPVQVKGDLDGKARFETNVVKYQGAYRLYLNTQMRQEAGVGVDDTVTVSLAYDPAVRMPPMPELLRAALSQNKRAGERWRLQPRARRKEILAYLNSLKTEASLKRNIKKTIEGLVK
jgi:hypothetical protein